MSKQDPQILVEEATFDFSMGDNEAALRKLSQALELAPDSFEAWHAKTEILFSMRQFEEALESAQKAHTIRPEDIHISTSLSRIYMEMNDKNTAEHYGAQARMLSWKNELKTN